MKLYRSVGGLRPLERLAVLEDMLVGLGRSPNVAVTWLEIAKSGGSWSIGDVARVVGVTDITATKILDTLINMGLVERDVLPLRPRPLSRSVPRPRAAPSGGRPWPETRCVPFDPDRHPACVREKDGTVAVVVVPGRWCLINGWLAGSAARMKGL